MELQDLRNACLRVAESTLGNQAGIQIKSKDEHANRLYKIAFDHYEISKDLGCTVPMLVRAVDYLCQAHAIPPLRDSTVWFEEKLETILEIACPNAGLGEQGKAFLKDMMRGIKSQLKEN